MTEQSTSRHRRAVAALLIAALLSSSVSAQPPAVSVEPRIAGPVGIADLRVLLDEDMQFQMFDFEAEENFCLALGYEHEIEGQQWNRGPFNHVFCNLAGPQRLIVVMRPAGKNRRLSVGLHGRDTGAGSGRTFADLPIGTDLGGAATFFTKTSGTIRSDRETTLFRWRFGPNPPDPRTHHDVRILVRLEENDFGIRSYSRPNEFSQ